MSRRCAGRRQKWRADGNRCRAPSRPRRDPEPGVTRLRIRDAPRPALALRHGPRCPSRGSYSRTGSRALGAFRRDPARPWSEPESPRVPRDALRTEPRPGARARDQRQGPSWVIPLTAQRGRQEGPETEGGGGGGLGAPGSAEGDRPPQSSWAPRIQACLFSSRPHAGPTRL